MATATTKAATSSTPTRRPIPQGLMPPMSPVSRADRGGGASSPCLPRAAFSLSSKERGSSSPGSSLISAPGGTPRREAGACYSWGRTVSRMQPPRWRGVAGPLRRRHGTGGRFVRDHCRHHVAAIGLHGRIDQHLEEQVALGIAAAEQANLFLARLQQLNHARVLAPAV